MIEPAGRRPARPVAAMGARHRRRPHRGRPTDDAWSWRRARDGSPAQRLVVDDATGLLLGAAGPGPDGRRAAVGALPEPSTSATVAGRSSCRVGVDTQEPAAQVLTSVPDGYQRAVVARRLRARRPAHAHPDGVLLFYSDGLFTASVFEQQGELDWSALPDGGRDTRARRHADPHRTASRAATSWCGSATASCTRACPTRRATCSRTMVDRLADSATAARARSIVDFVLGPFGWD